LIIALFFAIGSIYIFAAVAVIAAERKRNLLSRLGRARPVSDGYSRRKPAKQKEDETGNVFTRIENWLLINGVRIPLQNFMLILLFLISAILLTSVFFKAGILMFFMASAITVFFIYISIDFKGRRVIKKKEDQLESVMIDMVTVLHVNSNIQKALKKAAESAEDPIRRDLELVIEDTQKGLLLNEALLNMLKKNRSRLIHIVITGLVAANEKGVDLIEFLKSQIEYLREKKSLANYIRILSTGPRYTSYIIIVIPQVVLLVASILNPDFTSLLFSMTGRIVLIYSAISYLIGFLLINRIVSLSDHDRRGAD
jgi:tight adherence protein B